MITLFATECMDAGLNLQQEICILEHMSTSKMNHALNISIEMAICIKSQLICETIDIDTGHMIEPYSTQCML